jgi:hypothetical protein
MKQRNGLAMPESTVLPVKQTCVYPDVTMHHIGNDCGSARGARYRYVRALVIGLVAILFSSAYVRAQVDVQGDPAAVRIVAKEASASEVLNALGAVFNVRYDTLIRLEGVVSGTYQGSLEHVLSRVLSGYNYVIKTRDGGIIDVIVSGKIGVAGPRHLEVKRFDDRGETENDFEAIRLRRWQKAARAHRRRN